MSPQDDQFYTPLQTPLGSYAPAQPEPAKKSKNKKKRRKATIPANAVPESDEKMRATGDEAFSEQLNRTPKYTSGQISYYNSRNLNPDPHDEKARKEERLAEQQVCYQSPSSNRNHFY